MAYVLWSQARQWIILTGVSLDHKSMQYSEELGEFAESLRDGVILCAILDTMKPGCIQYNKKIANIEKNEFLCKKNISVFLEACQTVFHIKSKDLFQSTDLYDLLNFGLVLHTLSVLSRRVEAIDLQWTPIESCAQAYGYEDMECLADLVAEKASLSYTDSLEEESIYDQVEKNYNYTIYDSLITNSYENEPDVRDTYKSLTKTPTKRDFILQELVETEDRYVKYVRTLIESYIPPILECITSKEKKMVFMNIEEIYQLHLTFYRELSPRKLFNRAESEDVDVLNLNAFVHYQKEFLIYAYYCTYLEQSSKCVDQLMKKKSFRNLIDSLNKQLNRKFPLQAQLAVCFQRVLKYPLLLKELKKNTSEDHEDFHLIDSALLSMEDVASYINDYKRDIRNVSKIKEIQSTLSFDGSLPSAARDFGRHMQDGEVQVKFQGTERKEKRFAFLFEHAILFCKGKGDMNDVREVLEMDKFALGDCPGTLGKGSFNLKARNADGVSELKNCTVVTKSEQLRIIWVKALEESIRVMTLEGFEGKLDHHCFTLTTFDEKVYKKCDICHRLMLGLISQGYLCRNKDCKLQVHYSCLSSCPPCQKSKTATRMRRAVSDVVESRRSRVETERGRSKTLFDITPTIEVANYRGRALDTYPWFAGILSREQSIIMLQGLPDGSFLIRQSEKGGMVLSIRYNDRDFHIKIQEESDTVFLTPACRFPTVEQLISFYRSNSLGKSYPEVPIVLSHLIRSSEFL